MYPAGLSLQAKNYARLQRPARSVKRSFSGWDSNFGQVAIWAGKTRNTQ